MPELDAMPVTTPSHDLALPRLSVDLARAARRSAVLARGWSEVRIVRALRCYRRFLALVAAAPDLPVAPTRDIDVMWHLHMASPRAYLADCERLFGGVLDHDGGFGKGEGEEPVLVAVFQQTARRYEAAFGEAYAAHADGGDARTDCWHDCQGRCWHACSSKLEAVH